MSEILEGVLSEEILDALATDLGIEGDVLRSHPFFRVLKGRVLLTYPLRSSLYSGDVADAVWDEDRTAHVTAQTYGKLLYDATTRILDIHTDYARRTAYAYSSALATGATYVPVAGTLMTLAVIEAVCGANEVQMMHGVTVVKSNLASQCGFFGAVYCDGTDIGIKQGTGASETLSIEGITL